MTQLAKKWLSDDSVDGSKLLFLNGHYFRVVNGANNGEVEVFRVRADNEIEFKKVPKLDPLAAAPSAANDFVTYGFVEDIIASKRDAKDAVDALSDVSIALTGSTPLVIDGYTVLNNDRLGLVGQTTNSQNGIYSVSISAGTYTLTRALDANTSAEVTSGMYFKVINGTSYQGYECLLTTDDPIVLDTTSLTFAKYPSAISIVAGDGIGKIGNTLYVDFALNAGLYSTNPGNDAGQLGVKVDTATLVADKSTRIDSNGSVVAGMSYKETFALTPTDISNGYVDLQRVAQRNSVNIYPEGAGSAQREGVDFTVNYTGGASSKTRVTFAGELVALGNTPLAAGESLEVSYVAVAQ